MSDVPQGDGWWRASDDKWYPPESAPGVPEVVASAPVPPVATNVVTPGFVLTIGDIGITHDTVVTPNGNAPLAGSQWLLIDRTTVQSKIPTWAIVMAIIFSLCALLGLLFLLVKESVITGYAEVSVRSENLVHMTQLPVYRPRDIDLYRRLVAQAQTLAAQAAARP